MWFDDTVATSASVPLLAAISFVCVGPRNDRDAVTPGTNLGGSDLYRREPDR
ncbi:hypothetical protein TOK_1777 [Pseudonocardia sp. N23]|nr:hypothetical protein TOK_1777 [Pseudonocardia sp. N23]